MHKHLALLAVSLTLLLCGSGCSGGQLLNRSQLKGADPSYDLASTNILQRLRSTPSHNLSVRGVRLLDTIARAKKLWGPPTAVRGGGRRYLWVDPKGAFQLRLLTFRMPNLPGKRIRQIDVFSGYGKQLHPGNRALLDAENISSPSWRSRIFGIAGKTVKQPFDTRYHLPGYRMIIFSKLLRLRQKKATAFTLHLTSAALKGTLQPRRR